MSAYGGPAKGLPGEGTLLSGRAVFTEAYAVIPKGVLRDIVTSLLPGWEKTRAWVLARPLSGFAETFSHMILEIAPGGGSGPPPAAEPDPEAEAVLFVTAGTGTLILAGTPHPLTPGHYAYIPAGTAWRLTATGAAPCEAHWIRKRYEPAPGLPPPAAFVTHEASIPPSPMPGTEGRWATKRFVDTADLSHDMHVNIVSFAPGGSIPFLETHVMEHGLFVLEGHAAYRLNRDWVEVEAGDFLWLRAFCPQACYAGGPGPFRYLLYKDVNRVPRLSPWPR